MNEQATNRLACIQMASGPKVEANLDEAGRLIAKAAEAGAAMVVLPEHFAQMGLKAEDKLTTAEDDGDGPIQRFLAETARRHGIWLVGGSIPIKGRDPNRVRTAVLVYDDKGERRARYDKMHLFDVELPETGERYEESATMEPGEAIVVVDTPLGRTGLCVCYDIRFPEMFREQVDQGAELIVVPSAFTAVTGKAHWQPLLVARAIENQCYVAAAAQGGYHVNGRETWGHSLIVGPWGKILDELASGSGFVIAEIDRDKLAATRRTFPALAHRRLSGRGTN